MPPTVTRQLKTRRGKYIAPTALMAFGVLFTIGSAFASLNSEEIWFARSGAILTFVSVVAQSLLSTIKRERIEDLFDSPLNAQQKFAYLKHKDPLHESLSALSGILGLVGTLIWGYGDLWF